MGNPNTAGRAKAIANQLDIVQRNVFCGLLGVNSPYSSIFVNIEPVILLHVIALVSDQCGHDLLYSMLLATAPKLTSVTNTNLMIKNIVRAKSIEIAQSKRKLTQLISEESDLIKMLRSNVRGD